MFIFYLYIFVYLLEDNLGSSSLFSLVKILLLLNK